MTDEEVTAKRSWETKDGIRYSITRQDRWVDPKDASTLEPVSSCSNEMEPYTSHQVSWRWVAYKMSGASAHGVEWTEGKALGAARQSLAKIRGTKMEFSCPRRMDINLTFRSIGNAEYSQLCLNMMNPDVEPDGLEDYWDDGKCSYCGSLMPALFLAAVAKGDEIVPTDKAYKVYLGKSKFNPNHMTQAESDTFRRWLEGGEVKIGFPGHFYNGLYLHPRAESAAKGETPE